MSPRRTSSSQAPLLQKIAIGAARQSRSVPRQATNARTKRFRRPVPFPIDALCSEEDAPYVPQTCPVQHGVMDTQHLYPSIGSWIARIERRREAIPADKIEKAAQRQYVAIRRHEALQMIAEQRRAIPDQRSFKNLQPDASPAIGQHSLFPANSVGHHAQPGLQSRQIGMIGALAIDTAHSDGKNHRIQIGMPDDPRLRSRKHGIFRESEAPSEPDPPCPG